MALQSGSYSSLLLLHRSSTQPLPPRSGRRDGLRTTDYSRPRPVLRAVGGRDAPRSSGDAHRGPVPVPTSNYVVPLEGAPSSSPFITRPIVEILRDLNKRIPDNVLKPRNSNDQSHPAASLPWYHANRMLSFYAPGWCGEVRDVIYSDNGSVTVVYRVTVRGSDGEAHRESSGTVSCTHDGLEDPVAAAEEIAFCRACARFGLGLYLYHEE